MAARLTSLLPRIVALTAILVLGSATLTFAAENKLLSPAPVAEAPVAAPPLQSVPDVTGQAYVFAKGTLEEQGFAWRVVGSVAGYPANTVVSQTPAAGTRLVDTGAPTILLGLAPNSRYSQQGEPENASPYAGTVVRLPVSRAKPAPAPKPARKPVAKPAPKPAAKPAPKPRRVAKRVSKPTAVAKATRPPAFVVAGAPAEPLDEISLPDRARRLQQWVASHREPTPARVRHWLYQHEWIVTGARFGWFGGADALRTLVAVDEQVQKRWGVGAKSEARARRALAAVAARSR